MEEYPVKGRGAMGVKTIGLTEKKGGVAGALIVREHQDLVFISQSGMVQRTGVKGISKQGRPAQGVRVMNLREDDMVSAVALVMDERGGHVGGRRRRRSPRASSRLERGRVDYGADASSPPPTAATRPSSATRTTTTPQ